MNGFQLLGQNWKNKITIPQEFQFHHPGNIVIPSPKEKKSRSPSPIQSQRDFRKTPDNKSKSKSPMRSTNVK
jgi:hypothetical protein